MFRVGCNTLPAARQGGPAGGAAAARALRPCVGMDIPVDWIRALQGGALIGVSASLMLAFNGRVTGISGIVGGLVVPKPGDVAWRALFVAGLLLGGFVALAVSPAAFSRGAATPGVVALAGLLVGFGTRVGNGCTSGHGVCGIARLSPRSLAATVTFITAGAVTVFATGAGS